MWIKLLLLFFVFSFLFKTDTSFNQDLGRHLKLGEIILKTRMVPDTNLFSYTNPDFPFINTHWLFEAFVYVFSQTIGLYPLLILKIAAFLASVWLIIKIVPSNKTALLLPLGFIFFHVLRERTELRPEIFSFLFTASTYYILEKFISESVIPAKAGIHLIKIVNWIPASAGMTKKDDLIFLLPLIQFFWINTHIYFFVGLVLQAIFLTHIFYLKLRFRIENGKLRLLNIIFIFSVLFSLINPNGLNGLLYPSNVTKNYGYTIVENQTMFLLENIGFRDPNFLFVKISAAIIVISLLFTLITRKFMIKNILIAAFGLALALLHMRSFPYLVFLSFPAVLMSLPSLKFRGFVKSLTILTVPLLMIETFFYLSGDYYRHNDREIRPRLEFQQSVKGALDFVLSNNLSGPIYNNFDIGSYLLYRGFPRYRVFVDGRPEAYPANFFLETYIPGQADYAKFKQQEEKWNFQTVIFSHTDQTPWGRNFLQNIVKDNEWKLVYLDDFMIVLVRDTQMPRLKLGALEMANLNPNDFKFESHVSYLRIGIFLLASGHTQSGERFIQKTLQIFPQSPIANAILGRASQNNFLW